MISIVFDMDGVLFDTQRLYVETWFKVAELMKIGDISEPAYLCVGINRADQRTVLKKYFGEDFDVDEFNRIKDKMFSGYLEENGVPLKEGTVEILEYLHSIGAKIAIASSSRVESITHHLRETGIEKYFYKIVGGDMVEHSKPLPDIYLKACEQIESIPEETYAVEDSYNGIRAAYRAGMKTIMIPDMLKPTSETDSMVCACFDSLKELVNYFKEIKG